MALPGAGGPGRELAQRVVVGAGLAVVATACLLAGGTMFVLLVTVASALALREWRTLDAIGPSWRWLIGLLYIGLPASALIWMRLRNDGVWAVLATFLLVWGADIGAYVAGRAIGGPKLWPAVSPSKTWAGVLGAASGACLGTVLLAWLASNFVAFPSSALASLLNWRSLVASGVFGLLAVAGDLFESWLKRRAGVKDSGNLLPGHGGVLDRLDSLVPVAPAVAVAVWLGWL